MIDHITMHIFKSRHATIHVQTHSGDPIMDAGIVHSISSWLADVDQRGLQPEYRAWLELERQKDALDRRYTMPAMGGFEK